MEEEKQVGELREEVQRWTAKRRVALVMAVMRGETSVQEAARRHALTVAETQEWKDRFLLGAENVSVEPGESCAEGRQRRALEGHVDTLGVGCQPGADLVGRAGDVDKVRGEDAASSALLTSTLDSTVNCRLSTGGRVSIPCRSAARAGP